MLSFICDLPCLLLVKCILGKYKIALLSYYRSLHEKHLSTGGGHLSAALSSFMTLAKWMSMSFFQILCVCICVYVYMCVLHVVMCIPGETRGGCQMSSSVVFLPVFLDWICLSLTLELTTDWQRLASKFWGSSYLCCPLQVLKHTLPHTFNMGAEKLRSSCLYCKRFPHWAISPSHFLNFQIYTKFLE